MSQNENDCIDELDEHGRTLKEQVLLVTELMGAGFRERAASNVYYKIKSSSFNFNRYQKVVILLGKIMDNPRDRSLNNELLDAVKSEF